MLICDFVCLLKLKFHYADFATKSPTNSVTESADFVADVTRHGERWQLYHFSL